MIIAIIYLQYVYSDGVKLPCWSSVYFIHYVPNLIPGTMYEGRPASDYSMAYIEILYL